MTSLDMEHLADTLETRNKNGLPGLSELKYLSDNYLVTNSEGWYDEEDDYE